MRFLLDMGVSRSTVKWLHKRDHDVIHVRDLGMHTSSDAEIIESALLENRIILTFDLDFGSIMAASSDRFPSVIIFRLMNETPDNLNRRLEAVLSASSEELLKGAIISVEEERYRVRRLPIK